ncbi:MAG: DUF2075 domain-containing protein [Bacteroidales bacterium]|nr:DUF2075 domain-containing protein [Bacteroidales bacterium]
MRLYAGSSTQFIQDTVLNQIAEKLKSAFFQHFRHNPSLSEINSWRNSLRAIAQVFEYSGLTDHGILLEYQLPMTSKRLDCMICGKDTNNRENAIIIELKQWDNCLESDAPNEVMAFVGGARRDVLHPSVQVGQYKMYLEDTHTAFYENDAVNLFACSYLHNYQYNNQDVIFAPKFTSILSEVPLFTGDNVDELSNYLIDKLDQGNGLDILARIEQSKYRPSKKLMDHVGSVIKGKPEYILLDEQLIVYDRVLLTAKSGFHDKQKSVVLIKGGPGTGKSVIAINLMADLLLKNYNAQYATGSRAFTETLREAIGRRGAPQFRYFNSYTEAELNAVDVLICDEAHRIRKTSNNFYTPVAKKADTAQIEEIIKAAKVSVFFIDDDQVVRPDEIGSSDYIKHWAQQFNCKLFEYELETQFRCAGSDAFINWINNTLGIHRTANVIWNHDENFEFKIFSTPEELEEAINQKLQERHTARMTAGFCWPWSDPRPDGTLVEDVQVGYYKKPWNAKPNATRLAPGIPKAPLWAYAPGGKEQIGCIYTAQGFEFDFVGVIVGMDLRYNFDNGAWEAFKEHSFDSPVRRSQDRFLELVKNTYRVLFSRGMKGCYVYFMDKDTERFFRSRME